MSAGVEIWRSAHTGTAVSRAGAPNSAHVEALSEPYFSLVQQIFFSSGDFARRRVLIVGADSETNVVRIGEQVAKTLGEMKIGVALVEKEFAASARVGKKRPGASRASQFWSGFQVNDFLWRIPASILADIEATDPKSQANGFDVSTPFECVVCVNNIGDEMTSMFCGFCQSALLVITANRTRREAALHAKRQLQQCGADLIGIVLDGRRYPIPKSIYRRL